MRNSQPEQAILRGVDFLVSAQRQDGSFSTGFSRSKTGFVVTEECLTTFGSAMILQALSAIEAARPLRERLATWLQAQQSESGAYNYWPRNATERTARPYPDDLDDTACALAGLASHNPKLVGSAQLARTVQLLVAAETEVGGPYKTWLVSSNAPHSWQGVDLAVNANILFLLQTVAEPLPRLQSIISSAAEMGNFSSAYYPDDLVVLYFLARTRPNKQTSELLISEILKRQNGVCTPLQTALAYTSLCRLGYVGDLRAARASLQLQQLPDGSWPATTVWLDRKQGNASSYAGSAALTAAFVLEALTCKARTKAKNSNKIDPLAPAFFSVSRTAARELARWPVAVRLSASSTFQKLQQGDTGRELVLLPYLFVESLHETPPPDPKFLTKLSLANIFGWMAYTLYDDLLDGEGAVSILPTANTAMRRSLQYFRSALPGDDSFAASVHEVFDRIDAANAWEVTNCRFSHDEQSVIIGKLAKYPSAVFLSERSLGHCLTPIAILAKAGSALDGQEIQQFTKGFRHYLAARQLNDDLHDWQDDARNGQASYVVTRLLSGAGIRPGRHSIAVLLPKLERYFWQEALAGLCDETTKQLNYCRHAFATSKLLRANGPLLQLVERLEQSIARTLDEQQRALDFLRHYTNKNSRKRL